MNPNTITGKIYLKIFELRYTEVLDEEEINLAVIYPEEDVIVVESVELNLYEQDF